MRKGINSYKVFPASNLPRLPTVSKGHCNFLRYDFCGVVLLFECIALTSTSDDLSCSKNILSATGTATKCGATPSFSFIRMSKYLNSLIRCKPYVCQLPTRHYQSNR